MANQLFDSQTARGLSSFILLRAVTVTTTESNLFIMDSGALGLHSMSVTIKNLHASIDLAIDFYVSNDLGESTGWLNLANVYGEDDASISLPLTIAAGATDHMILGYKNQPQYTLFRYWRVTGDAASSSVTCNVYAQGR